jgi:hypothetical protein
VCVFVAQLKYGANPTIVIYNASSSLARFENKIIFLYYEKNALAYLLPTMLAL